MLKGLGGLEETVTFQVSRCVQVNNCEAGVGTASTGYRQRPGLTAAL